MHSITCISIWELCLGICEILATSLKSEYYNLHKCVTIPNICRVALSPDARRKPSTSRHRVVQMNKNQQRNQIIKTMCFGTYDNILCELMRVFFCLFFWCAHHTYKKQYRIYANDLVGNGIHTELNSTIDNFLFRLAVASLIRC